MTFEDLPNELLFQILDYIPDASHIRIVSKQFNDIIKDIEHRVFKNPDKYIEELSPPVYFLLKDNKYHKSIWDKAVINGTLELIPKLNKLGYKFVASISMRKASSKGYKDLVDFFVEKGADNWDHGMSHAAKGGHKDLVDFFIEKGANDWNNGMAKAAGGGYKDLVEFFIEKGANNWDQGIEQAELGGHKDLVKFFIEKDADNEWML